MSPGVVSALIAGLTSLVTALGVALTNHWFTRKKTAEEIKKLQADTALTLAQAQQITENLNNNLNNLSDKVSYRLSDAAQASEKILYASEHSDDFNFRVEKIANADGGVTVKDGILNISRTNTEGTLQVWLESYSYAGKARLKVLPKNENISGDRRLRVSCEVKAVGGEHTLLFIMKAVNAPLGQHMAADKRQRVTSNEWVALDAYFRVSPGQDCQLRIDNRSVSAPGSSVQIRKLILAERNE
jgi:hypothetical protein